MDDDMMLGDLDTTPTAAQEIESSQALDNSIVTSDVVATDEDESSSEEEEEEERNNAKSKSGVKFEELKRVRENVLPEQKSSKKKRKNDHGDEKREKESKKAKKSTKALSKEDKQKKKNLKAAKSISETDNDKLRANCIELLKPYQDESVFNIACTDIEKQVSNLSERAQRNFHDKDASAYFPLNDGHKHLRRAGICRSAGGTPALINKLSEIYMISLTSRTIPFMDQDKRKTIYAKDVYHGQKSTGHAFV